ncbi:MAG: hypothetical protein QM581_06485 [Pseudomonas sp.]
MNTIANPPRAERKVELLEASQEVKEIMAAERRVLDLEERAAEYADEPDTLASINTELGYARARLERLVSPWRR